MGQPSMGLKSWCYGLLVAVTCSGVFGASAWMWFSKNMAPLPAWMSRCRCTRDLMSRSVVACEGQEVEEQCILVASVWIIILWFCALLATSIFSLDGTSLGINSTDNNPTEPLLAPLLKSTKLSPSFSKYETKPFPHTKPCACRWCYIFEHRFRYAEKLAALEDTPIPHTKSCHCFKCSHSGSGGDYNGSGSGGDCAGCIAASTYKRLKQVPDIFPPRGYVCYPCTNEEYDADDLSPNNWGSNVSCRSDNIYCKYHDDNYFYDPDDGTRPKHVVTLMGMEASPLGLGVPPRELPKVIQLFLDIGLPLLPGTSFLRGCEFVRLTTTCRAARFDVSLRNLIKYYNILWQHWHAMPGEYCYSRKTELCKKHLWPLIA